MGGHRGGETASAISVEVIPEVVRKSQKKPGWTGRGTITEAIEAANRAIYKRSTEQPSLQGMGTTTTALLFKDGVLTIGHVGDSRCYYFNPGSVWQATRDHSLVQEKLRAGLITRAEVKHDRMKNVITRSVGFEEEVQVEVYEMQVKPHDVFLICSDGLSGMVEDPDMLKLVQKHFFDEKSLDAAVEKLIDGANQNGGDDNVTTLMVEVLPD